MKVHSGDAAPLAAAHSVFRYVMTVLRGKRRGIHAMPFWMPVDLRRCPSGSDMPFKAKHSWHSPGGGGNSIGVAHCEIRLGRVCGIPAETVMGTC